MFFSTDKIHQTMRRHTIGDGEAVAIDPLASNGSYLADTTGKLYLDCDSQFASLPVGWNHPTLVQAASYLGRIAIHKIANSDWYTRELAQFTEAFAATAPDFQYFFFVEGGTLGVENALKAAFDWKAQLLGWGDVDVNRLDVIHLKQAFHGRSGYSLSLTNTDPNKTTLFPKYNWTRITNPKIDFPMVEADVAYLEAESLNQAEDALKKNLVAAIILETIQGEGGDNHFRSEYFKALRELANRYEAMLILDEVQAGVGLTGKMWAYQHFGIKPDMIAFGKKTQVCGFASTNRIDSVKNNVFKVSSRINSTWGGNIVDMVRFTFLAKIIKEENLVENARVVGDYFLEELRKLPRIRNVRGRGLMIAFDLEDGTKRMEVLNKMKQNMTALKCGERSIRLRPHLTFSKEDADAAVGFISSSLAN